jgi:hypothetical protein
MSEVAELTIVRASEIEMDPARQAQFEQAYRRGYAQGAAAAVDALERSYTLPALRAWLDRLMDWRYAFHTVGDRGPPPRVRKA